jgi:hypothetical protein
MSRNSTEPPTATRSLSDPKLTALCLALGARLVRTEQDASGRLVFVLAEVPDDFHARLVNDKLTVSAKRFITEMESILGLIASHKRTRTAP